MQSLNFYTDSTSNRERKTSEPIFFKTESGSKTDISLAPLSASSSKSGSLGELRISGSRRSSPPREVSSRINHKASSKDTILSSVSLFNDFENIYSSTNDFLKLLSVNYENPNEQFQFLTFLFNKTEFTKQLIVLADTKPELLKKLISDILNSYDEVQDTTLAHLAHLVPLIQKDQAVEATLLPFITVKANQNFDFICHIFKNEICQASDFSSIFREDGNYARLLRVWLKDSHKDWFKIILPQKIFKEIDHNLKQEKIDYSPREKTFRPSKQDTRIARIALTFLTNLSKTLLTEQLGVLFKLIRGDLEMKFGVCLNSNFMYQFLFLRIFSACLTAPETFGFKPYKHTPNLAFKVNQLIIKLGLDEISDRFSLAHTAELLSASKHLRSVLQMQY